MNIKPQNFGVDVLAWQTMTPRSPMIIAPVKADTNILKNSPMIHVPPSSVVGSSIFFEVDLRGLECKSQSETRVSGMTTTQYGIVVPYPIPVTTPPDSIRIPTLWNPRFCNRICQYGDGIVGIIGEVGSPGWNRIQWNVPAAEPNE